MQETILISGISAIIGGLISFFLQNIKHKQEMQKLFESNKTEFMAETTARYFLNRAEFWFALVLYAYSETVMNKMSGGVY